jgi:hypothetical protein
MSTAEITPGLVVALKQQLSVIIEEAGRAKEISRSIIEQTREILGESAMSPIGDLQGTASGLLDRLDQQFPVSTDHKSLSPKS